MITAICPGSFDPITLGHLNIIRRASRIFDEVIVCILNNASKTSTMFTVEERLELIKDAVGDIPNVETGVCGGILVEYCRSVGATVILRGIRSGADVEYESMLEQVNTRLDPGIGTVYMLAKPEHAFISSSLVRQLINTGISIEGLVPNADHTIIRRV